MYNEKKNSAGSEHCQKSWVSGVVQTRLAEKIIFFFLLGYSHAYCYGGKNWVEIRSDVHCTREGITELVWKWKVFNSVSHAIDILSWPNTAFRIHMLDLLSTSSILINSKYAQ